MVYGKEDGKFLISDPVMDYTTSLSEAELEKVRYAKGALPPKGHMYYPVYVPENVNLEDAIKKESRIPVKYAGASTAYRSKSYEMGSQKHPEMG